jgi:hypothetical protein
MKDEILSRSKKELNAYTGESKKYRHFIPVFLRLVMFYKT